MADPESRGIDIKVASDTSLIFGAFLLDSSGDKVTSGTTSLRIFHQVPTDGSLEGYDFDDDTFKTSALTTATAEMTHRQVNNAGYNTGVWTYRHSTLTDFESGHQYFIEIHNGSASPAYVTRWCQYGWGGLLGPVGTLEECQQSASNGMTFAQLRDELALIVTRVFKANDRFVSPTMRELWINAAYQEVDRKLRWTRCSYSFDTVIDTAEYTIPSTVREYIAVEMADSDGKVYKLTRISLDEYIGEREDSTTSGCCDYWVHHGDKLILYPTPDEAYTVKVWAVLEAADMTDDSTRPGFPAHLHRFILEQALVYAYQYFGEIETATNLDGYLEAKLAAERKEPALDREGKGKVQRPAI